MKGIRVQLDNCLKNQGRNNTTWKQVYKKVEKKTTCGLQQPLITAPKIKLGTTPHETGVSKARKEGNLFILL